LRVVDVDGRSNAGFWRAVAIRAVIPEAVWLVVPFSFFVDVLFIFRGDRRCLHDLLAQTVVVSTSQG
ncbi:MAG TPA: RDD family protein, partial [Rubricoccaceae bacterium]